MFDGPYLLRVITGYDPSSNKEDRVIKKVSLNSKLESNKEERK
jgi:hypothetical protein